VEKEHQGDWTKETRASYYGKEKVETEILYKKNELHSGCCEDLKKKCTWTRHGLQTNWPNGLSLSTE
jgi:hypothetical protein